MAIVRATLNGAYDVPLLVDSGADRMLISRLAATDLGPDLARPVRFEPLVGVGHSAAVPVVRLDHVPVGASVITRLEASVDDLPAFFPADGLLGLNFLRRFRVTFEFDTGHLVLRPPPPRRTP